MTPLLTLLLIGKGVEVSVSRLFLDTFQVVILPTVFGILLNFYFPKISKKIQTISPFVAVLLITMIVASILGAGRDKILQSMGILIAAVISLHVSGFLFGYFLSWLFIRKQKTSRTISIEVGMQNSGLGVVLSRNNFQDPWLQSQRRFPVSYILWSEVYLRHFGENECRKNNLFLSEPHS